MILLLLQILLLQLLLLLQPLLLLLLLLKNEVHLFTLYNTKLSRNVDLYVTSSYCQVFFLVEEIIATV